MEAQLGRYMGALRRRRAENGVFATKLQFGQFDRFLRNRYGAALFDGATVVHLFRPDVATQYALRPRRARERHHGISRSVEDAVASGRRATVRTSTSTSSRRSTSSTGSSGRTRVSAACSCCSTFARSSSPRMIASRVVVGRIADALKLSIDEEALSGAIALSAAYGRDRAREKAISGLAESVKKIAFQKQG